MKIRNPYSKNRLSKYERIKLHLSKLFLKWCERHPNKELCKNALHNFDWKYNVNEKDEHLELYNILIMEVINKEDIYLIDKALIKIMTNMGKIKTKYYRAYNSSFNIDSFENSIDGGGWQRLLDFELHKKHDLFKFIKLINIKAIHLSNSLIALTINLNLADEYRKYIHDILYGDIDCNKIFF